MERLEVRGGGGGLQQATSHFGAACGSGGRACWLVTGRLLLPYLIAPDELSVALNGLLRCHCVNVCVNG